MANSYYTFTPDFVPGQKVRSDEVNLQYNAIDAAFDNLPSDVAAINRGKTYLGTESGTADALVLTLDDPRTTYLEADRIFFKATNNNNGAATINVDGIGVAALVSVGGVALESGDIIAGVYYEAVYDLANTRWQLTSASAAIVASANDRVDWAEEWAINPEDDPVSVAAGGDDSTTFSALHWAAKASDSASAASTSETNADNSATAAAASAASINLPAIGTSTAGDQLKVNAGKTGYDFYDIKGTANTWAAAQQFEGSVDLEDTALTLHVDNSSGDARALQLRGLLSGANLPFWDFRVEQTTDSFVVEDENGDPVLEIAQGAALLETTATQLLFDGVDVAGPNLALSVYKTADEDKQNDSVIAADADLVFANIAAGRYAFDAMIFYNSAAAADMHYRFLTTGTDTANSYRSDVRLDLSITINLTYGSLSDTREVGGNGSNLPIQIKGVVEFTSGTNTFEFAWAQDVSNAGFTSVLENSWIILTPLT